MSVFKNALPENGQRSTTCGNWIADIATAFCIIFIVFILLHFRFRNDSFSLGRAPLRASFPFDNAIYCYEITGEELLQVFEYSLASAGKGLISQVIGIDCYFTDRTVNALVTQDGKAIYVNGEWAGGWKDKTFTVAISDYMATTDRSSGSRTDNSKTGTSSKTASGSQKGNAPQTGDTNNLLLWGTLAVLSALGLTLIALMYLFSLRDWRK